MLLKSQIILIVSLFYAANALPAQDMTSVNEPAKTDLTRTIQGPESAKYAQNTMVKLVARSAEPGRSKSRVNSKPSTAPKPPASAKPLAASKWNMHFPAGVGKKVVTSIGSFAKDVATSVTSDTITGQISKLFDKPQAAAPPPQNQTAPA